MNITIRFEPRDLWIGAYWNKGSNHHYDMDKGITYRRKYLNIFVCLFPMIPILFHFQGDDQIIFRRISVDKFLDEGV